MPTIEEIIKTSRIDDPYMRAILTVMYTGNWMHQRLNHLLKPFDLTEQQYNVLRILRGQHGAALSLLEVQSRMVQQMSNTSRLVEKLYRKGYLERRECTDNRRKLDIWITEAGMNILQTVEPLLQQEFDLRATCLNREEAGSLADLLDKLRG